MVKGWGGFVGSSSLISYANIKGKQYDKKKKRRLAIMIFSSLLFHLNS